MSILKIHAPVLGILGALFLFSCGSTDVEDTQSPQATPAVEPAPLARCDYRNPFSSEVECKEYVGVDWTTESAQFDCETAIAGGAGTYVEGARCEVGLVLGTCTVTVNPGLEYLLQVGGDNSDQCSSAELACTSFVSGSFEPSGVCVAGTGEDEHTVFIWPYQTCDLPIEGEDDGDGPDGTVCVWNLISGCTEEGRDFRDYGSCDVVFTNRPYYPVPSHDNAAEDDPRYTDDAYLTELEWVVEQTSSCACVCCHSGIAPEGPAIWGIDSEPLWPVQMSDTAVGMFAGYIDSSALGAFPPDENNGFDRENTAMPSTDPERMVAFWLREMELRGLTEADMSDELPVGQSLLDQVTYELPDCSEGDGIDVDGLLRWESEFTARYIYILEEGSMNPGLPPNFDDPAGVLWRVDVPYDGEPMTTGVKYGVLPNTTTQEVPGNGEAPPELVQGQRYHLYVLYDVALPISRCVFEVPGAQDEDQSGGCSHTGGTPAWALALLPLLAVRRRRR
jgi:Synergist-CTERM protein sorting domain-containing protein